MTPFNSHLSKFKKKKQAVKQKKKPSIHFRSVWCCRRPPKLKLKASAQNSDEERVTIKNRDMISCSQSYFSVVFEK